MAAKLCRLGADCALSFFGKTSFDAYTAVTPYLVRLDNDLATWIGRDLWQQPWGILIFSKATLEALFQHFRRFFYVRAPDGNSYFFRFFDPRILPVFCSSADALAYGFWHPIEAFGWSQGETAALARWTSDVPPSPDLAQKVTLSPELMHNFEKMQLQNFLDRALAYLHAMGVELPGDPAAYVQSLLRYAVSVGIENEVDLVRFLVLVSGWGEMPSIDAARDILSYPELPGSDKVDLLCEMAAFGGYSSPPAEAPGLDREAHRQALKEFLEKHRSDARFLRIHPDGSLSLRPADARWRKEWVQLYCDKVAARAQVTFVPMGSSII